MIGVVGRQRELELVRAALASGAHILLEGPPGTGKSTLLRQVAESRHTEFVLVEGSAELTPARLIGSFDPALVLEQGYRPENFSDGPLVRAMRQPTITSRRRSSPAWPAPGGVPSRTRWARPRPWTTS